MSGSGAEGAPVVPTTMRATDVQRFGLLSAAAVVARYAEVVDRTISGADPLRPGEPGSLEEGAARLTQAWLCLMEAGAALVDRTRQSVTPAVPAAPERLEPPATAPGGWTETSVWVHNPTSTAAGVTLHATTLVSEAGVILPPDAVQCSARDEVRVAPLGSRGVRIAPLGSCEVRVRVVVPAGQDAGRYHGLLVGSLAPEPMPLLVVVAPPLDEDVR